jgi:hypothetical protein
LSSLSMSETSDHRVSFIDKVIFLHIGLKLGLAL